MIHINSFPSYMYKHTHGWATRISKACAVLALPTEQVSSVYVYISDMSLSHQEVKINCIHCECVQAKDGKKVYIYSPDRYSVCLCPAKQMANY